MIGGQSVENKTTRNCFHEIASSLNAGRERSGHRVDTSHFQSQSINGTRKLLRYVPVFYPSLVMT